LKIAVVFTARARRQLQTALQWWQQNREKAPNALRDDLDDALELLIETHDIGVMVGKRGFRPIRRYHLQRTSYDIYYFVAQGVLTVTNVWHSSRRPPSQL